MPVAGARTVVRSRSSSARATAACACFTRAAADEGAGPGRGHLLGPGLGGLQIGVGPLLARLAPAPARLRATCTASSASRTCAWAIGDGRPWTMPPRATAASYCCCDTSSLASSPFSRSLFFSSRTASASSPDERAPASTPDALRSPSRLCCASSIARLRLLDAALRRAQAAARGRCRDGHIRVGGRGFGLRRRQLGARAIESNLVVAQDRARRARPLLPRPGCRRRGRAAPCRRPGRPPA